MKSATKLIQIIIPIFLILLICGICGGMLYDLGDKMPIWLKILMGLVLIFYPVLNIIAILSIPTIDIQTDSISTTSFFKHQKIYFEDISKIDESIFKNKVYKIGKYYSIQSAKGNQIDIPYGIYKNELAMMELIKQRINK